MKQYFITAIIAFTCLCTMGQSDSTGGQFGFALNTSMNGEIYPIRLVPTITYLKKNSQLELGFGLHPFIRKDQNIYSGELNYKYFPNGTDHKFNLYLLAQLAYVYNPRKTYYPTTYQYLFLNGGYGFQLVPFKNAYMGTNMSIGTFTNSKQSDIPYSSFEKENLFETFGFNLAFQFNIGYRL